jgi:transposase
MDNLAAHKTAGMREAVKARGGSLMSPSPYSPDLNPIENAFAKLKALLRTAEARTKETFWRTIGVLLDRFRPSECRNMIRHAGFLRSG